MSRFFYTRLAFTNIKKNSKTYFPYIITCICSIMMYYVMHAISVNEGLDRMSGGDALKDILSFGAVVIAIFSTIFLFYTNSFLMKRRKKEIGIYNILGLEKKHIGKMLLCENVMVAVISLGLGLVGGIILNKLMFLVLLKILRFPVTLGFYISAQSILRTLILFMAIFLVSLAWNLFHIRIANPIELLRGGKQGEREPKTKWIITIIGVVTLAWGYKIALTVEQPLSALTLFFLAVILVMIGTYALFTAGSIALLKLLRRNKKFYYRTKNFITVSSMMYRMKQNAVGLANICILSTAVLVTLSTTVSLYSGMEDILKTRYAREVMMSSSGISLQDAEKIDEILDKEIESQGIAFDNRVDFWYSDFHCSEEDGKFSIAKKGTYGEDTYYLMFVPVSDLNELDGKNIRLQDDEVAIYSSGDSYDSDTIIFENKTFKVKEEIEATIFEEFEYMGILDSYIIVVNNLDTISSIEDREYSIGIDVKEKDDVIVAFTKDLNEKYFENDLIVNIESRAENKESFFSLYGGLFFIGIFIGALFLMATVLIIYYKQISEGYDDKERYEIMQKVGMSKVEIKKTIRTQILMVFFLPLLFAVIHIAFAFPIITKMLVVFNLKNVGLYALCTAMTILVFSVIYGVVFAVTARVYYGIVEFRN